MVKEVVGARSQGSCEPGTTSVFTLGEMGTLRGSEQGSTVI